MDKKRKNILVAGRLKIHRAECHVVEKNQIIFRGILTSRATNLSSGFSKKILKIDCFLGYFFNI